MPARHFKIAGNVQGVGFRYAMCAEARRLRLVGWVRNRSDGSVEAVAAGDEATLQNLARWVRRGPAQARVDDVQVRAATDSETAEGDDPFKERPTV